MKFIAPIIAAAVTGLYGCSPSPDSPVEQSGTGAAATLEQMAAEIDAGRRLPSDETSITRARHLLDEVSQCYKITPKDALGMATKFWNIAQKDGKRVDVLDMLDAALILCSDGADRDAFVDMGTYYLTSRVKAGQTHHQSVRGVLILTTAASALGR